MKKAAMAATMKASRPILPTCLGSRRWLSRRQLMVERPAILVAKREQHQRRRRDRDRREEQDLAAFLVEQIQAHRIEQIAPQDQRAGDQDQRLQQVTDAPEQPERRPAGR